MTKERIQVNWIGSWWGVFFTSLTALGIGLAFGCVELVFRKVDMVEVMPRSPDARHRFFVKGQIMGGDDWREKLSMIIKKDAQGIALTEGDFNLFLASSFSAKEGQMRLDPSVKVMGNRISLGFAAYPKMLKDPLCFQSAGTFVRGSDGFCFAPSRTYLGCLPIPREIARAFVNAGLRRMFADPQAAPLLKSWKELKDVTVGGNYVRLSWQ